MRRARNKLALFFLRLARLSAQHGLVRGYIANCEAVLHHDLRKPRPARDAWAEIRENVAWKINSIAEWVMPDGGRVHITSHEVELAEEHAPIVYPSMLATAAEELLAKARCRQEEERSE